MGICVSSLKDCTPPEASRRNAIVTSLYVFRDQVTRLFADPTSPEDMADALGGVNDLA
jgi:hypothetical protein